MNTLSSLVCGECLRGPRRTNGADGNRPESPAAGPGTGLLGRPFLFAGSPGRSRGIDSRGKLLPDASWAGAAPAQDAPANGRPPRRGAGRPVRGPQELEQQHTWDCQRRRGLPVPPGPPPPASAHSSGLWPARDSDTDPGTW